MKYPFILASALLLSLVANTSAADTLELADGTIMEGDFVGSSNGIVMFNAGDSVEAFPESQVVGIYLSEGVLPQPVPVWLFAWRTRSTRNGTRPGTNFAVNSKGRSLSTALPWRRGVHLYMARLQLRSSPVAWRANLH